MKLEILLNSDVLEPGSVTLAAEAVQCDMAGLFLYSKDGKLIAMYAPGMWRVVRALEEEKATA